MQADSPTRQSTPQDVNRTIEFLDHVSMGIANVAAAEGSDVWPNVCGMDVHLPGRPSDWPWHKVLNVHVLSASEWRTAAISSFYRATEIYPEEPWIWFQLGWLSFAYEDGPCDLKAARAALDYALALDPDSAVSHLALACLMRQEAQLENPQDQRWIETAWCGPIGEHLRSGLSGDLEEALVGSGFQFHGFRGPGWGWVSWLLTPGSRSILFKALDAFWDVIPNDYRFACAMTCGRLAGGDRLTLEWCEEALKWPTDNQRQLCDAHWRIARCMGHHLVPSFQHYLKAYEHMVQFDFEDLGSLWLEAVSCQLMAHGDNITKELLPTLQKITDVGLEMADKGCLFGITGAYLSNALGPLVATTGRMLFEGGDVTQARIYLEEAEDLESELEATWDTLFPNVPYFEVYDRAPDNWRVVTARALRDICIIDGYYPEAKRYNDHVLELLPRDRDALKCKPDIDSNTRADRHHDEITQNLNVLHNMADALLSEIQLQRTAAERLAQIRDEIETLTQRRALAQDQIDVVIEELHDIVQRGLLMQPLAVRKASQRLLLELGTDEFSQLQPDSQHFLTTAEVFLSASEAIAPEIDAALISVEYAKAVETELRNRFLPALGRALDARHFGGSIPIQPGSEIKCQGRMTWENRLSQLRLGQSAGLLSQAARGPDTGIVLKTIGAPPLDREWLKHLADDLERVAFEYRNGAAHVELLERAKVLEFRDLLLKGGLIKRLVELGKIGDRISSIGIPRR